MRYCHRLHTLIHSAIQHSHEIDQRRKYYIFFFISNVFIVSSHFYCGFSMSMSSSIACQSGKQTKESFRRNQINEKVDRSRRKRTKEETMVKLLLLDKLVACIWHQIKMDSKEIRWKNEPKKVWSDAINIPHRIDFIVQISIFTIFFDRVCSLECCNCERKVIALPLKWVNSFRSNEN